MDDAPVSEPPVSGDLGQLLDYIRRVRRFDFSGYKRSSLVRRIGKRMQEIGCNSYADYQDYLEVHPNEFGALFNTILINVTSFFRDAAAWDYVAAEVVPRIVSGKQLGEPIRVWSAGCASGEEAYSLGMLFSEVLGIDQFRARVKIYGTDADEEALTKARQASYSMRELDGVPVDYVQRYFDQADEGSGTRVFRSDLRRSVIFGRHDLVQDAPISRLDLLVCRNTLMYFNAETQQRILERFNFALGSQGFLFLGKADTLLTKSRLFEPVDLRLHIFSKAGGPPPVRVLAVSRRDSEGEAPEEVTLTDLALDDVHQPLVVVDLAGNVALINALARSLFNLRPSDLGVPIQNLEFSYRPLELRSVIAEALGERRVSERRSVRWSDGDDRRVFDVAAVPLVRRDGMLLGAGITFTDVTEYQRLKEELEQSNRDLETAYEELQSTNEELETTNEELRSSNEELETTNEELQSSNDELHVVNEELQSRSTDLDQANSYLQAILSGLRLGIVVLDGELVVRMWNRSAEDLWGLRAEEVVDREFLGLDIGLPLERLEALIRRTMTDGGQPQETLTRARSRRGRDIECRVLAAPLALGPAPGGVILVMEERQDGDPGGKNR
jgi:two-component system, chemotaxis family, CheB/CheR fusion protein